MRALSGLYLLGWGLALATLGLMAFAVPLSEMQLGTSYLIFFYHFPSAINCLVFFLIAGGASLVQLKNGSARADRVALAAVEVGVLACTITLATGSIWAKAAWGHFWVWDEPRLLSVAILWFTYLGYLALRASIESHFLRARAAAVFGVLAALNVPVVWYASTLYARTMFSNQLHPKPQAFMVEPIMRFTMWFGVLAFFILYLAFLLARARVIRVREEAEALEAACAERGL